MFAGLVVIVDPRGEFPLDDDWNFALSSWHFADTGTFRFARLTGMSLRLQVLWGALWTEVFGRSFEVLRFSTLTLSLTALLVLNRLLARIGLATGPRLLATFALLAHPIFFWSSFTFMTHVPFVTLSVVAFYFHLRGITERDMRHLLLGAVAVVGSYFIRQTGISSAIAPLILLLLLRERVSPRWKSFAVIVAAPLVLFAILWFGTNVLKGYPGQLQVHLGSFTERNLAMAILEVIHRETVFNFQYGFLFLLPILASLAPGLTPRQQHGSSRLTLAYLALLIPFVWMATQKVSTGDALPYNTQGEVFVNFGLGPATLRDTRMFGYRYPFHLPEWLLAVGTFAAAVGGAWLLFRILAMLRATGSSVPEVAARLAALHALVATGVLFASSLYFDRYALDSLWAVIVFCAASSSWSRATMRTVAIVAAMVGFFSVFATQEYLRWNRARWQAFDYLQERGVTLEQMDGGYEINQYLLGGFDGPLRRRAPGLSVVDDAFILAFRPVPGYATMARFPFQGFLGLRRGHIYAEHRVTGFKPDLLD